MNELAHGAFDFFRLVVSCAARSVQFSSRRSHLGVSSLTTIDMSRSIADRHSIISDVAVDRLSTDMTLVAYRWNISEELVKCQESICKT